MEGAYLGALTVLVLTCERSGTVGRYNRASRTRHLLIQVSATTTERLANLMQSSRPFALEFVKSLLSDPHFDGVDAIGIDREVILDCLDAA